MSHGPDYTRWNRAGLSRMSYVDGNAAAWLEELRLALTSTYGRGAAVDDRDMALLRDLFLDETPKFQRDLVDTEALRNAQPWDRLRNGIPAKSTTPDPETGEVVKLETRGQRSTRLTAQYSAAPDPNYAWEILRGFARALHVTSGHLNAHVNEGYLRTATQWDNLRRLAAMVNYQPTPAASASTVVGLTLKEELGAVEVPAGLAMKHQPAKGQPLIFETTEKLNAHPALNAARVEGWNVNSTPLPKGGHGVTWIAGEKDALDPGSIAILTGHNEAYARIITDVLRDEDNETAKLEFQTYDTTGHMMMLIIGAYTNYHNARLWIDPDDIVTGLRRPEQRGKTIVLENAGPLQKGDLIRLEYEGTPYILAVKKRDKNRIEVVTDLELNGSFEVTALTALKPVSNKVYETADPDLKTIFFEVGDKIVARTDYTTLEELGFKISGRGEAYGGFLDGTVVDMIRPSRPWRVIGKNEAHIGNKLRVNFPNEKGFMFTKDEEPTKGRLLKPKQVLDGAPDRIVSFEGKPSKALKEGVWFALQRDGQKIPQIAQVKAFTFEKDLYHVLFDRTVMVPHKTEFVGPMRKSLRPVGHDRNPDPIGDTEEITLCDIPLEALDILRPGRALIICNMTHDGAQSDVLATLKSVTPLEGNKATIKIDTTGQIDGFVRGDTVVRMNALQITHGESKGPKTLGSGDGEIPRQEFVLKVGEISHVPSTLSETGVIPALDVTVDGQIWRYSDYIDPAADDTKTWSSTLGEDGYLRLHFRRRLPTGMNNVAILRHRVGTGLKGTGIPPHRFTKPMKKNPFVEKVHQPFPTSGGADREPVASLRSAAPSRLAANGRAVSLRDFERLAARHASVWRARGTEVATGTRNRKVVLTIVPAGGDPLPAEDSPLKTDLGEMIRTRALPGVTLDFDSYQSVLLRITASVRADIESYDKIEIKAACEAAVRAVFDLEQRDFGQPAYVSEVLAALETVTGVATANVSQFDYFRGGLTEHPNTVSRDGMFSTIFPRRKQIAHVGPLRLETSNAIEIHVGGLE